jgi:hypothetical protein
MKSVLILALVGLLATVYLTSVTHSNDSEFVAFMAKYAKSYKSQDEYAFRKKIFDDNVEFINEENKKGNSWTLGVNKFADFTKQEYRKLLGYKPSSPSELPSNFGRMVPIKDETIDWRKKEMSQKLKTKDTVDLAGHSQLLEHLKVHML